ncbi:tetraacyldisaccharide 4'-kinase [Paucidesulfovibrio longus]|uniref:tetraacyldisaccharide 4'-kinase n=1 Tax=Paucidesulfovibrio longus TaxID=889 RepID=UPI0003B3794D|nr:tetraacyldisaccharide 4'-kinase [Paucidesulfovibrio longus]
MNIERYQDALHPLLAPLGALYSGAMRLRRAAYASGLLPSWRAAAPTVSVGNIGWGGTGKTPITDWLLGWAEQRGLAPLVLTRGYGARPASYPHLVRPGHLAEEAGDEPLMLCRRHPGAAIVVDPARSRAGRWAEERLKPGVVILDDGFQHLAVRRDVNLVLLKPADLGAGWNRVIPAGSWREGGSALEQADAFLIKISERSFEALLPRLERRLRPLGRPVFSFEIAPQGLVRVLDGEQRPNFSQQPYLLVTGVGDPAQVERTASRYLGHGPREHLIYPDHHAYTRTDVKIIEQTAEKRHCAHVLCTPKDAVKLGPMARDNFWTFDLDVRFGPAWRGHGLEGARFDAWWEARFEKVRAGLEKHRKTPDNSETARQGAEESENFGKEK